MTKLTHLTAAAAADIKDEAASLAETAADFAKEKVIQPAGRAYRDARDHLENGIEEAHEALVRQRRRAALCIAGHPFVAVGLAAGAGALVATILRRKR